MPKPKPEVLNLAFGFELHITKTQEDRGELFEEDSDTGELRSIRVFLPEPESTNSLMSRVSRYLRMRAIQFEAAREALDLYWEEE